MFFKANSLKDVFIHLGIITAIFFGLIILFFYVYLPATTHHGETITVPKLEGMSIDELEDFLASKDLRYQINDSSYAPGVKPLTVLTQHPTEGSKVKQNRKIYVTIASKNPPKVKMPKLIDGSLKSAEMTLKGYDLVKGDIKYIPSPYTNLVIDQLVDGKKILPGTYIPKGTKVDLVVGNGTGATEIEVPELINRDIEEAKIYLAGLGLSVGIIKYDPASDEIPGTVIKQKPSAGKIRIGESIDIWVAGDALDLPQH
ncbi:MAG TPA: PASTA domain-containing protein [Cytophagaceae bacterium]